MKKNKYYLFNLHFGKIVVKNIKVDNKYYICNQKYFYKNNNKDKWCKAIYNTFKFLKLYKNDHSNIIKEYNTFDEVLIDFPELMLL